MGDAHLNFAILALQFAVLAAIAGTVISILISLLGMARLLRNSVRDISTVVGELELRLAETNRSASK